MSRTKTGPAGTMSVSLPEGGIPQGEYVARTRNKFRIALDIPHPERGKRYLWAADPGIHPAHPQTTHTKQWEGWKIVPKEKAGTLGLDGFHDPNSDKEVTKDVGGGIRFGDVILMETSEENWQRIYGDKQQAIASYIGAAEDAAAEQFERAGSSAIRP